MCISMVGDKTEPYLSSSLDNAGTTPCKIPPRTEKYNEELTIRQPVLSISTMIRYTGNVKRPSQMRSGLVAGWIHL